MCIFPNLLGRTLKMKEIGELVRNLPLFKPVRNAGKRAILLIKIAELTGMTDVLEKNYWSFAGKFSHLKGDEGYKVLNWMYETALCESGEEDGKWRKIKFWTLLKESHEAEKR